jgi:asparagine synthase (glutamine-hydrolysing)
MQYRFMTACGQPSWHRVEKGDLRCFLRGNVFLDDRVSSPAEIAARLGELLEDPLNRDDLRRVLLQMNGEYAVVLDTPDTGLLFADRVRSIPLFYAQDAGGLNVTDSAHTLKKSMNPDYIEENGAEFLTTGFITGSGTLYAGIRQLQAGEYLIYDKKTGRLHSSFYHRYLHGNFSLLPEDRLIGQLDEVMTQCIMRLRKTTGGKQIVVPLSGGLDSRIIVALLHRLGARDVVCYTYGKREDRDAAISRQVAEHLGYEWHFVE